MLNDDGGESVHLPGIYAAALGRRDLLRPHVGHKGNQFGPFRDIQGEAGLLQQHLFCLYRREGRENDDPVLILDRIFVGECKRVGLRRTVVGQLVVPDQAGRDGEGLQVLLAHLAMPAGRAHDLPAERRQALESIAIDAHLRLAQAILVVDQDTRLDRMPARHRRLEYERLLMTEHHGIRHLRQHARAAAKQKNEGQ